MTITLRKYILGFRVALIGMVSNTPGVQAMEGELRAAHESTPKSVLRKIVGELGTGPVPDMTPEQVDQYFKERGYWKGDNGLIFQDNPFLKEKVAQLSFYESTVVQPAFTEAGFREGEGTVELNFEGRCLFWKVNQISHEPHNQFSDSSGVDEIQYGQNLPQELVVLWATKEKLLRELYQHIDKARRDWDTVAQNSFNMHGVRGRCTEAGIILY
ncbi:MAG: hypothetical protein K2Y18_00475 [Alphaproteobacteria bacterium]|nr:hypothetical protein [Alphaproteobacteria bacterium]